MDEQTKNRLSEEFHKKIVDDIAFEKLGNFIFAKNEIFRKLVIQRILQEK